MQVVCSDPYYVPVLFDREVLAQSFNYPQSVSRMPVLSDLVVFDSVFNALGICLDLSSRDIWARASKFWSSVLRERTWLSLEGSVTVIG